MKDKIIICSSPLSIKDLATKMDILPSKIIKFFFFKKQMVNINYIMNVNEIETVCLNFGFELQVNKKKNKNNENLKTETNIALKERPPIITIMGHVDHGKTTLIDVICGSNVADKEIGGISQSIKVYQKKIKNKKITLIDTPGHELFEAIRNRGASVTDIVVLVVAADDGVMPQTIEAIQQAKKSNVPILVAINKIDKENANIEKIKNELANYEIVAEDFGGKNIFCEVSAKKNIGIDYLLENLLLISEMLELKADYDCPAEGVILESKLHKNKGPMALFLVQNGTLKKGDYVVSDTTFGCIKEMLNEKNESIEIATPATPVFVTGLNEVPNVGCKFYVVKDKKLAHKKINELIEQKKVKTINYSDTDFKSKLILNLLICADSISSIEAIENKVNKIIVPGVKINILNTSTGIINDNDIVLAKINHAIIYTFNIKTNHNLKKRINDEKISIYEYDIIYDLIDSIEDNAKKKLKPSLTKNVTGRMEIRKIFYLSKTKTNIAGCYVLSGYIKNKSKIDLIRNGNVVHSGEISSLKHQKDNIDEARKDSECGAIIKNFNDIKEKDIIEAYELK